MISILFLNQFSSFVQQNHTSTHRQNLYYLSRFLVKDLCYELRVISDFKYTKGTKESNVKEKGYWFNSENQYLSHVLEIEKKVVVNSYTRLEESSLYEYNEKNYIHPSPHLLFYICRH